VGHPVFTAAIASLPAHGVGSRQDLPLPFTAVLIGAAAVTLGAVGAAAFGQKLSSADSVPLVRLPAPADAAGVFPKGVESQVRGITPLRTSNGAFYRVDTNLTVPRVSPDRWQLEIDGMVERPMTISYRQLMAMPMIERDITLTCVSNEVGGGYVGAARWQGVRLADLLDRVGVRSSADQLLSTAVDGFQIGTPMEVVRDGRDAMIAVGMNGQPLPAIHGFSRTDRHPRSLWVCQRHQVADQADRHDIRQGRLVLDQTRLGHRCGHQDVLTRRHPPAACRRSRPV